MKDDNDVIYTDPSFYDQSSGSSGGGTAIVIVIAVLIIVIPIGFIISCIVKRIKDRNKKKLDDNLEAVPLPDSSQVSSSHHNMQSPDQPNNLYPFNGPIGDQEDMTNVMQAIQQLERN